MSYQEALDYLLAQLPMFQKQGASAFKKGLDNILSLCEILDNPHQKFRTIHVAGTNGKGSSSHLLAAVLQAAGYKVGLYTSPHLKNYTERIRINGQEISENWVVDFVQKNKKSLDTLSPSFFEVSVAMAFDYFAQEKVDVAVIEVGMGGRLDSTNVISPLLSLITNISFDHQQFLGDTLPLIAAEKAGIIKKNTPVVISEKHPETESVFRQKAQTETAPIFFAQDFFEIRNKENGFFDVFKYQELFLENMTCQLKGSYQSKNWVGVLQSLDLLNLEINKANIRTGFEQVCSLTGFKGRWQTFSQKPLTICDTGHNEAGIKVVVEQIAQQPYEKLFMVLGMTGDKDLSKMLAMLPKNADYIFCQANMMRAMPAQKLAELAQNFGLFGTVIPDVNEAIRSTQKVAKDTDFIFVGGSTFVVAEIEGL